MKKKKSFEDNLSQLEHIVEALESGEITLEEALKMYEEGVKLARLCSSILAAAETKVTQMRQDLNGQIKEEPFLIADTE